MKKKRTAQSCSSLNALYYLSPAGLDKDNTPPVDTFGKRPRHPPAGGPAFPPAKNADLRHEYDHCQADGDLGRRISLIVSLIPSFKIMDVINRILKLHRMNGQGTCSTKTDADNCCYFWAMTPAKARLSVRQLPNSRFWIFEGHFPNCDQALVQNVCLLLSHIDGLSRIVAMGGGRTWYFDSVARVFRKNINTSELSSHDAVYQRSARL